MDEFTRDSIRKIFLTHRPHTALFTAAELLGIPFQQLRQEIAEGTIVATSTSIGLRIPRHEMIAAAFRVWDQGTIEEALGAEGVGVLPEAIRLVELRARVPRYQRDMLRVLAERQGTTVDDVLTRELEDVACAYAEELAGAVPGLEMALAWP